MHNCLTLSQGNKDHVDIRLRNNIILSFFSVIIWFFFPILSIIIFLLILGYPKIQISKKNQVLLIILISCSFGLISYVTSSGGSITTDMIRYRQSFDTIVKSGLDHYDNSSNLFVFFSWIIANYISTEGQVMSFLFTATSYLFIILSLNRLTKNYLEKKYYGLILMSIVIVISIITTTEYLKQVLSTSIFIFGLSGKFTGKRFSYISVIIAFLVHPTSAIMTLPVYFYDFKIIKKNIYIIILICLIISQLNLLTLLSNISNLPIMTIIGLGNDKFSSFANFDEWGGSRRYFLIFSFYLLQICPIIINYVKKKEYRNPIFVFFLLTICILLFNMGNNHNFARLTKNFYMFHIIAIIFSIQYIPVKFRRIWVYFLYFCLFASNQIEYFRGLIVGEYYSTFMGNDCGQLLSSNVLEFFNYKIDIY